MPSDRQIYFLWAALSTLIAQSAYHPKIETCSSADFKACSVECYLYTPNTAHWQYYQPCCMMNDNNQNKVPVDRQASTKYQSVIIHFYKT